MAMFAMMLKFKVQNPSYSLQAALGAKFEILFGMKLTNVRCVVFLCNLIYILNVGTAATKVKMHAVCMKISFHG
jgi:hypothetical protein